MVFFIYRACSMQVPTTWVKIVLGRVPNPETMTGMAQIFLHILLSYDESLQDFFFD